MDDHNVASDTEWWAILYVDGVATGAPVDIDAIGGNPEGVLTPTNITFPGIDHTDNTHTYTVVITADLQLHELDILDPNYEAATTTMMTSSTFIDAGN